MIKKIFNRRIPHILGSYLIAGTSLVLFIEYLVHKYEFPVYLPTMSLIALIGILPSVLILAYFHGAPGKDEWTKIEKIGIPINVLFIGIIILFGNNYNWWLGDITITESLNPKRLIIAEIKSENKYIDFAKYMINKYEGVGTAQIELLTDDEKNNLYDELITYLGINKIRDNIEYYTKYQLEDEVNKRAEKKKQYTFAHITKQITTGNENWQEIQLERRNDKNSMYNYIKSTFSDFGYFPLVYKNPIKLNPLKGLDHLTPKYKDSIKYFILHSMVHNQVKINDQDTAYIFHNPHEYKLIERNEMIEYMGDYILNTIRSFISVNQGVILDILNDNKILFKYDKKKSHVQTRMILETVRKYKYRAKTDDFDDFIGMRMDDLLSYEYYIDQDTNSLFYKKYYNNKGPDPSGYGLSTFTKDELNMLLDGSHIFFKYQDKPTVTVTFPVAINIKIRVNEVYDSTATAEIYKIQDPNIKLKVGDIVLY